MTPLFILLTAIIFFYIGKYAQTTKEAEVVKQVQRSIEKRNHPKPGVLPFKTPEQFEAERNGEAALEKHWRESGLADEVMK